MLSLGIMDALMNGQRKRIKGRVVLIKKNVLDFNDFWDSILDRIHEFLDQKVTLYLISSLNTDPNAEPDRGQDMGIMGEVAGESGGMNKDGWICSSL